jgi:hypothetical protein
MKFVKPEFISVKNHQTLTESWIQDRIAEDPTILGLGDLVLRDKERPQPRAGRLDLLLQDPETTRRYEVEIQLGKTDETHIIRTIEYWDVERKRYPQYDHCAVIVAEEITARFLNVISLFNGSVPLIAIQMRALRLGEDVSLIFTTVLDELTRGLVDEDEEVKEVTNRAYWESRATKQTVAMADQFLEMIREFAPNYDLKYNKFYIGLAKNGQPDNFVYLRPKKNFFTLMARIDAESPIIAQLDDAGLEVEFRSRENRHRVRLTEKEFHKHRELLKEFLKAAYANRTDPEM